MKKYIFSIVISFSSLLCSAQKEIDLEAITDSITAEGKRLYQSEMASWYGTDIFVANYKDRTKIGGYLSYMDKDTARCIFFSKGDAPVVIGTISFDDSYT